MPFVLKPPRGADADIPTLDSGAIAFVTDQRRVLLGDGAANHVLGVQINVRAVAAPGVGDDAADGYSPGSLWADITNDLAYICLDSTAGAAVWQVIGSASAFSITGLTAADPDLADEVPVYDLSAAANRKVTVAELLAVTGGVPPGRLSLSDALAVTTADASSSGALYYQPCVGDRLRLWDGTRHVLRKLGSTAASATPGGMVISQSWTANKNYDIFAYSSAYTPSSTDTSTERVTVSTSPPTGSRVQPTVTVGGLSAAETYFWYQASGTTGSFHTSFASALAGTSAMNLTANITCELLFASLESLVWTNDSTRATALASHDGIYYKSGDQTRLYLGTVRADSGGTIRDTVLFRGVWNAYNRRRRPMKVTESADNWTYATNTWRSWNNSTANRVEFVLGVAEDAVDALFNAYTVLDTAGESGVVGIGLDSTSANSAGTFVPSYFNASTAILIGTLAHYRDTPAAGYHYLQCLERARVGTVRFDGDGGTPSESQCGMVAEVWA